MDKIRAVSAGLILALLAVAPPLDYTIPIIVNSFSWCYLVVASGLLGMVLVYTKLPVALKLLSVYLWVSCFYSFAPYLSFNAYILVVACLWFFLLVVHSDTKKLLDFVTAAFFVQVFFATAQLMGKDTLMNFDRPQPVFLGTVMQYMRFSSLLAVMAPLLALKNKWFVIPVIIVAVVSKSSSFGLAVIAGCGTYMFLKSRKKLLILLLLIIFGAGYLWWDRASFEIAITDGRIPVWLDIIRTWIYDTRECAVPIKRYYTMCPVDWHSIFFGRGMDIFMPLFPVMKHDMNPFAQAHNAYLQWLWEIGLIGTFILLGYCGQLVYKLWKQKDYMYISGLACIGTNLFFAFPDRITQSILMIICFLALCQKKVQEGTCQQT